MRSKPFVFSASLGLVLLFSTVGFSQTGKIWVSKSELATLPMSGPAWDHLKAQADQPAGTPNLADQDQMNNVYVLAKALVYARTGIESYRTEVINQCMMAINTELGTGGRTLSLGRELVAYVIAADLVGLPSDKNDIFKAWLRRTLTEVIDTQTLTSTDERRPNNWGLHAGASRAAVALYLGDTTELAKTAQVFRGWLGERNIYANFEYGLDLSWQCDPAKPVGINPPGCTKDGHSIDGVLPDDQRRAGSFTWPPQKENYFWEALQGAIVEAEILRRAGYDTFNWSNKALLRAYLWLHDVDQFPAAGDDTWQPHIVNYWYGSSFPAPVPSYPGKNMGYSDWTHGPGRATIPLSPDTAPTPTPTPTPTPPPPPPPDVTTRVQQDAGAVKYTGTWYTYLLSAYSGGSAVKTITIGSRATFSFYGSAAKWIGYKNDYAGIANVYVDGVLKASVDTYSSQVQAQAVLYSVSGLTLGNHTLAVEVTGKHRSASKGHWVTVDAFEYTAPALSALSVDQPAQTESASGISVKRLSAGGETLNVGYARVPTGNAGYALLQRRENATLVSEAAVPASGLIDSGRVAVDLSDRVATGLAIANPNAEDNAIDFFFTDRNGVDSAIQSLTVPANGQLAAFLNEAPFNQTAPFQGTLTFLSNLPVAVTTIRGHWNEIGDFSISTMPVAELSVVRDDSAVIPHVAFGQGWATAIDLINPTDETIQGNVQISTGANFPYTIAPRSDQRIQLSGATALQTGTATIAPAAGSYTPAAAAIFSYAPNGITLTESTALASQAGSTFQLDIDNATATRTGIAMVNTTGQDISVNLDLRDAASSAAWHVTLVLGANQRIARYIDEIPGFDALPASVRGILRVSSNTDSSLAALGLRTRYNERGDLLLTTTVSMDERTFNPNSDFVVPHFASGSGYQAEFLVFGEQSPASMALQFFNQAGQAVMY